MQSTLAYIWKHKLILLIILVGAVLTLMPFVFDGQYGCVNHQCGMIIGTNYRDGAWYLAVTASAFKTIPFRMLIFSGEILKGYHYLPNLVSYILSLVGIPVNARS